ncbi:hypothetical protein ElyMa_004191200 [Elysia marginata]|uniref:Uncharacterized protein n=1 Tax=Elysia marginata TaxID=1093978 RepID=A0AAV4GK63_9GAST|nr:hypothetical protein ElyMa_004191200 [Elysia marginata]
MSHWLSLVTCCMRVTIIAHSDHGLLADSLYATTKRFGLINSVEKKLEMVFQPARESIANKPKIKIDNKTLNFIGSSQSLCKLKNHLFFMVDPRPTGCQPKLLGSGAEGICQLLKTMLNVGDINTVISSQHVTNESQCDFSLCMQALQVKQSPSCSV